jgi:hypothetical protein
MSVIPSEKPETSGEKGTAFTSPVTSSALEAHVQELQGAPGKAAEAAGEIHRPGEPTGTPVDALQPVREAAFKNPGSNTDVQAMRATSNSPRDSSILPPIELEFKKDHARKEGILIPGQASDNAASNVEGSAVQSASAIESAALNSPASALAALGSIAGKEAVIAAMMGAHSENPVAMGMLALARGALDMAKNVALTSVAENQAMASSAAFGARPNVINSIGKDESVHDREIWNQKSRDHRPPETVAS